jgi:hypothetical protein
MISRLSILGRFGFLAIIILLLNGCGKSLKMPEIPRFGVPPLPTPVPIDGNYCTTWNKYEKADTPAMGVSCLQADGEWKNSGTPVDTEGTCGGTDKSIFAYPQLFTTNTNNLAIGYTHCPGFNDREILVKVYDPVLKWQLIGQRRVNDSSGTALPDLTQFGAHFAFTSSAFVFWETSATNYLTYTDAAGQWRDLAVFTATMTPNQRQYISTVGSETYIHTAAPFPAVWKFNSGALNFVGKINIDSGQEWTLQSALTKWDHYLVLAYSSINSKNAAGKESSWSEAFSRTKTAFYDLNNPAAGWVIKNTQVEQTPGHDTTRPFLFVVQNDLYILYADYTTAGLPGDTGHLRYHFRASRWDGISWVRIGGESEELMHSQIFEYTQDGDKVVFAAMRSVDSTTAQQIVVGWQNEQFSQVGGVVATFQSNNDNWRARPGKVVALAPGKKDTPPLVLQQLPQKDNATIFHRQNDCSLFGGPSGFRLRSDSIGIDCGARIILPGFDQCYTSAAPDVGMAEFFMN